MKFLVFGLALCLATIVSGSYLKEKPEFLKSCYLKDPNFKTCYANGFQTIFREWKDGIPGLKNLGKLDPMHVKRVKLSQSGTGSVSLHAELTNLIIKGSSKLKILEASLNKDMLAKVKFSVPLLRFDSDYKLDGRVLTLVLNGHGKAAFETENIVVDVRVQNKLRDEDGLVFCDIDSVQVDIKEIGNFRINLENLFNGQKDLEDSTNALFNQNWRDFYDVLRPPVEQTIQAILLDRFRKIFKYVPSTYFVADLPTAAEFYG